MKHFTISTLVLSAVFIAFTVGMILRDYSNGSEVAPAEFDAVSAPGPTEFVIEGAVTTALEVAGAAVGEALDTTDYVNIRWEQERPEDIKACVNDVREGWGTATETLFNELGPYAIGDLRICFDRCVRINPRGRDSSICAHSLFLDE